MVSGVRSSCDNFPPEGAQVLRVFVEARQQALEAARQRADFIGAGGFRHVEPDLAVAAHRGIGGVAQAPDAQADPSREAEHDGDGERRGQQREIEQTRHARDRAMPAVDRRPARAPRRRASDRRSRWAPPPSAAALGSRRCAPTPPRPSGERGGDAIAAEPVGRRRLQRPTARCRTVMKRRYQVLSVRRVSPATFELSVARDPELQRIGVDDGGAGAVADEGSEQLIRGPGVVKNSRPPSRRVGAHEAGLAAAAAPSLASIQSREPTKLNGTRASRW